jgi:hypothetical protein
MPKTFGHWLEWFMFRRLPSCCKSGERSTVETPKCAHYCVATTPTELTSQLDCSLISFGARVAEENLPGTTEKLIY